MVCFFPLASWREEDDWDTEWTVEVIRWRIQSAEDTVVDEEAQRYIEKKQSRQDRSTKVMEAQWKLNVELDMIIPLYCWCELIMEVKIKILEMQMGMWEDIMVCSLWPEWACTKMVWRYEMVFQKVWNDNLRLTEVASSGVNLDL